MQLIVVTPRHASVTCPWRVDYSRAPRLAADAFPRKQGRGYRIAFNGSSSEATDGQESHGLCSTGENAGNGSLTHGSSGCRHQSVITRVPQISMTGWLGWRFLSSYERGRGGVGIRTRRRERWGIRWREGQRKARPPTHLVLGSTERAANREPP